MQPGLWDRVLDPASMGKAAAGLGGPRQAEDEENHPKAQEACVLPKQTFESVTALPMAFFCIRNALKSPPNSKYVSLFIPLRIITALSIVRISWRVAIWPYFSCPFHHCSRKS